MIDMIHRKTKIVCTLGPATEDDAVLRELILSGMNVARLNFSHGTHETHLNNIRRIEAFRRELNLPIAIMLDTKGPEIRLETFENGKVQLKKGQTFTLSPKVWWATRSAPPSPIPTFRAISGREPPSLSTTAWWR